MDRTRDGGVSGHGASSVGENATAQSQFAGGLVTEMRIELPIDMVYEGTHRFGKTIRR